jgi:hypothetical protein
VRAIAEPDDFHSHSRSDVLGVSSKQVQVDPQGSQVREFEQRLVAGEISRDCRNVKDSSAKRRLYRVRREAHIAFDGGQSLTGFHDIPDTDVHRLHGSCVSRAYSGVFAFDGCEQTLHFVRIAHGPRAYRRASYSKLVGSFLIDHRLIVVLASSSSR